MAEIWEEIKKWLPVILLLGLGYLIYRKLIAPPPEAPGVEFIKVEWLSPEEFIEGETRSARLTFRNPTKWNWTYDVIAVFAGVTDVERVSISAGAEGSTTHAFTMPVAGVYDLRVRGVEITTRTEVLPETVVDTVRVEERPVPAIQFVALAWASGEIFMARSVHTARLTVRNISARRWNYIFYLEILVPPVLSHISDIITLEPGEERAVPITVTMPYDEGIFDVRAGAIAKVDG